MLFVRGSTFSNVVFGPGETRLKVADIPSA
jgi:hypothetical protein